MKVALVASRVKYYSLEDERNFFAWLKRVRGIERVFGVGNDLNIIIHVKSLPVEDITELIAVFRRYRIKLEQLAQLRVPENSEWFDKNRKTFWYKRLFPE